MTDTPGSNCAPYPWEAEGARLSGLLDDVYATVIAGTDSDMAAAIAVGIARVQGARRRVAIADLVGESRPLDALLTGDDPHGVSDSFLYGVSLNKIARPVNVEGTIFVMPSGTESVANEQVYANDRWRRLAAGFHQVGALLLIVAVPGTRGFAELCSFVGALMPVGATTFPVPPGVRLLAAPTLPPEAPALPPLPRTSTARARAIAAENTATRRRRTVAGVFAALAVAVAVGVFWNDIKRLLPAPVLALLTRPAADSAQVAASSAQPVAPADSVLKASGDSLSSSDSLARNPDSLRAPLVVANPADSARAARYSIYFATANNRDAATQDAYVSSLPGMTMSIVPEDGAMWYRVTVGANASRAQLTAMLDAMRARRVTVPTGSIIETPYAFRLADSVSATALPEQMAGFLKQGLAAYALRQPNGQSVIVTGAFETPLQANVLADSLQKIGITPVLIYRTGRAF